MTNRGRNTKWATRAGLIAYLYEVGGNENYQVYAVGSPEDHGKVMPTRGQRRS